MKFINGICTDQLFKHTTIRLRKFYWHFFGPNIFQYLGESIMTVFGIHVSFYNKSKSMEDVKFVIFKVGLVETEVGFDWNVKIIKRKYFHEHFLNRILGYINCLNL